jgi:nicotinamide riboside transporter PnuC
LHFTAENVPHLLHTRIVEEGCAVPFRLDYLSCVLTIVSTILVGRRCWEGWVLAAVNSVIVCLIGLRTAQFGFIPANVFCIGLYAVNLRSWRKIRSQRS